MIYDDFVYDDFPFRPTHPDTLGTIGGLFGLDPAPSAACRVLGLGCGLGGNLLAMASTLPDSRFVGVDLSARQIAHARAEAEALGLQNIEFHVGDIADLGPSLGSFDYIICHGVWSWVPPPVQAAVFRVCRDLLTPQGIAFVSYNTEPGWHVRGVLRSLLARNVPAEGSPAARAEAGRAYLAAVAEHAPVTLSVACQALKAEIDLISPLSVRYLFHEHLAEVNAPVWFRDFVDQAAAHALQYLGDAELHSMLPDRLGPAAAAWLRRGGADQVTVEARMDEVGMRFFRRSLLCHAGLPIDRAINADTLAGHWLSTKLEPNADQVDLSPGAPAGFTAPNGLVVSTPTPLLKAALVVLHGVQPRGLPLEALAAAATERLGRPCSNADVVSLAENMLELIGQGFAHVSREAPRFRLRPGRRPRAFGLARRQAAQGRDGVFTLQHISVAIDPLERALLPFLDGKHDRPALLDALVGAQERGAFEVSIDNTPVTGRDALGHVLESKLERLGRMALLLS